MSDVEYEIKQLIYEVLEDKGYLTQDAIEMVIDDALGNIDIDDKISNALDNIDMGEHIDNDSIISDAKDEAIEYMREEMEETIREEISESMETVRDIIDQHCNEYWSDDYVIETVNEAIVEGSINTATSQNGDSAFPPQGNVAFLKGALVCLTRYVESIESVGEEE